MSIGGTIRSSKTIQFTTQFGTEDTEESLTPEVLDIASARFEHNIFWWVLEEELIWSPTKTEERMLATAMS
jgi:hypothetical protein